MAHYIAMSGPSGCLPDYCMAHGTRAGAIADLKELIGPMLEDEASSERAALFVAELEAGDFANLGDVEGFGADYAEVVRCDCETPGDHDASGQGVHHTEGE